jgi:nitric oxide synthase-interacting protein
MKVSRPVYHSHCNVRSHPHFKETGSKRKQPSESSSASFTFSASTVSALQEQAEQAALKKLEEEQAERMKAKLPDFWLPSLTPTHTANASVKAGQPETLEDAQAQMDVAKTVCRGGASNSAHLLS